MKRILLAGILLIIILCSSLGQPAQAQSVISIPISILPAHSIAVVGMEYTYQVPPPKGRDSSSVTFKLVKSPTGMTLDTMTGIVKWTPAVKGSFKAEVRISGSPRMSFSYAWTIQVVSFLGKINGVVKNEQNELLKGILISVYKKNDRSTLTNVLTQLSAYTDTAGAYSIVIADSGEFYIQASPWISPLLMSPIVMNGDYIPVWYINSPTMAGATPVPVNDAVPVTANFTLKKYQRPVPVSLSGTVSDITGKPLPGATVVASFMPGRASTTFPVLTASYQDSGFGLFCYVEGKDRTDSTGNYTLTVLTGSPYVVAAYKTGYMLQYYNGKDNVLEADNVTVKGDTGGIDFKLHALPVATAIVSGVVADSAGIGTAARIILYPVGSSHKTVNLPLPAVRTMNTDSLGIFSFRAVPNGTYKLQVIPFGKFLPAYYKANDCGVRDAKRADTIVVAGDQSVEGLVVCVKNVKAHGGGVITGWIRNSRGSGLAGVVVTAESQNSCSYGITEDDGSYEIDNLEPGEYEVTTDKVGYSPSMSISPVIDYTTGTFSSQANLVITEDAATSVEASVRTLPDHFTLYPNYPNPFNPSTTISFTLPADGHATLRVFNMLGQVVATLVDGNKSAGTHVIPFDPGNALSSGVYIYELKFKERIASHKMILMK